MKRLIAIAMALVFVQACADAPGPTAPNFQPTASKEMPLPNPNAPPVCPIGVTCVKFNGPSGADVEVGLVGVQVATAPGTEVFAGRFTNNTLQFSPTNTDTGVLTFNLYIIGNWLGQQKKTPPHLWQIAYKCGSAPEVMILSASVSNNFGSWQSFPEDEFVGHHGGQYSAVAVNLLGYAGSGLTNYSPHKGDVADTEYAVQKTIPSCGTETRYILMRGKNLTGNVIDASWGIDNVSFQ